jgi:hypothetical protein
MPQTEIAIIEVGEAYRVVRYLLVGRVRRSSEKSSRMSGEWPLKNAAWKVWA